MVLLLALVLVELRVTGRCHHAASCSTNGQLKAWPEAVGRIWSCRGPEVSCSLLPISDACAEQALAT